MIFLDWILFKQIPKIHILGTYDSIGMVFREAVDYVVLTGPE